MGLAKGELPVQTGIAHPWGVPPEQAVQIQDSLRERVIRQDQFGALGCIAGVDVGFTAGEARTRAAVVVLSYPELRLVESAVALRPTGFPYVPGLLSFREAPALLDALSRLSAQPGILLCDGQGIAHPRRLGIASHLGLLADLPAIGVAKSILVGRHQPVPDLSGAWQPLVDRGEVVGAALRTRQGVKPVFVSIGHRISLETAIALVLGCCTKYRLPEPVRQAHRLASQKRGDDL
jgi:deoxyribonuclease V